MFANTCPTSLVPQFKKVDAGANILTGCEFANKVSLNLTAGSGLKNMNPDISESKDEQFKMKNTGFGVSVGYRF